ncbi:hypothetical protein [Umezawaea tangerina]|uniref:ABC-2 type transport system permease protein n=1 Tax=Umezawaea tangerina TaxID=84725 RepID=A0A2T0SXW0_9PSEU|nr:hypothetical protein [Umezawaea tangerina]PRY38254.1 hypothetical protein CLV43_109475 [Umezawaea tangerina]
MRALALYLRSRQVPFALPGAVVAVLLVARIGAVAPNQQLEVAAVVLAMGLGLAIVGYGLGGADPELERTAAVSWPPRRAAHLVAVTVVPAAALALATTVPLEIVLRAAVGFAGLTALAAILFGRQLAWTLPVAWAGGVAAVPPVDDPVLLLVLTWPAQPVGSTPALVTACVLGGIGLVGYALRGCRT